MTAPPLNARDRPLPRRIALDSFSPHLCTETRAAATPQDAARFLKVPVSWVYEHIRPEGADRLPFVKLGKYLRFDARDLRAYSDTKRAEIHQPPPSPLTVSGSGGRVLPTRDRHEPLPLLANAENGPRPNV